MHLIHADTSGSGSSERKVGDFACDIERLDSRIHPL